MISPMALHLRSFLRSIGLKKAPLWNILLSHRCAFIDYKQSAATQ